MKLNSVTQNFSQGNIEFTENSLDLAINGNGFFRLVMGVLQPTRGLDPFR